MSNLKKPSLLLIPLLLILFIQNAFSSEKELWAALKDGGKVILMRHALTQKGKDSGNSLIRDNSCLKEKKLSYQGKKDAEHLKELFSNKSIAIEKVLSSPFCRTKNTAKLAFDEFEPVEFLSLLEILSTEKKESQTEELVEYISSYKGEGNLVLISHEPNIRAISFELPKHLDFLVLEPLGDGDYDELGIIRFKN